MLPTLASTQVVGFLGYTGRSANAVATATPDPTFNLAVSIAGRRPRFAAGPRQRYSPYQTLAELLDASRAEPSRMTLLGTGLGSSMQLVFEMLRRR
jgi:hypothetical protein